MARAQQALRWLTLLGGVGLVLSASAVNHDDVEVRQAIARHRAMALAHEAAARCLETRPQDEHDTCLARLQQACKGLAIGRQCGLRTEP